MMKWRAFLKTVMSLEDSGLLLKGVSEAIQNKAKEQRRRFLSMLLGTLVASLSGDMLFVKKVKGATEIFALDLSILCLTTIA